MRLFPIRGGIHPDYRKELTSEQAIVRLPLPSRLYLPLQQHIGAPAEPVVTVGQRVKKGELLARGQGAVSAPTHAPASGIIADITAVTAPHPSGLAQLTIILEPDGQDDWAELPKPIEDPFAVPASAIRERVAECGIVGLGGASFPSAVKLNLGTQQNIEILLINGAECEPYLTCDDRLMREHAAEIVDGARIMAHALGAPKIIIAIERNKPQAVAAMRSAAAAFDAVSVVDVPVEYPMGSERHLTQAIIGKETPAKKLTAELGVVVHNVGTARAVQQAVRFGRPLIARVVTISGGAIAQGKNVEAPVGTMVSELIAFCGGLKEEARRVVNGGPMMGQPLPSFEVPVVKGTSGILLLTAAESNEQSTQPCIRCGTCVTICPCGLVPVEMAAFIRKDNLDGADRAGVTDCFSCGSCSYVCPSHIPLVQFFNYAKGELAAQAREKRRLDQVKFLSESRAARLERQAQAKREAAAAAAAARKSVPSENKASQ